MYRLPNIIEISDYNYNFLKNYFYLFTFLVSIGVYLYVFTCHLCPLCKSESILDGLTILTFLDPTNATNYTMLDTNLGTRTQMLN